MSTTSRLASTSVGQINTSVSSIAARIERLPSSRSLWLTIIVISLGAWFETYDVFFTGYVAPGMIKSGLFDPASLGPLAKLSVLSFSGFGTFVFATFAGLWTGTLLVSQLLDRFGRRSVFTWALVWYALCSAVLAFQSSGFAIDVWRFLGGIGIGVEFCTIDTYLAEMIPSRLRGKAFAVELTIGYTAVPIVALLSWLLVPISPFGFDGWRWVVLIGSTGAVIVWIMRLRLTESPRWLVKQGRLDEANQIVSDLEYRIERETGKKLPEADNDLSDESEKGDFWEMYRSPYLSRVFMLSVFNFASAFAYYGFTVWVPSLLAHRGVNLPHSLEFAFIIAIASPLGPLLGIFFADRFERKWILVVALLIMIISMLSFSQLSAAPGLIVCGVMFTLGGNIVAFANHNYQAEMFPTRFRMRALGFVWSWARVSAAFSGLIIGTILKSEGVFSVAALIVTMASIMIFMIAVFGPRTTGLSLEKINP